jgi:hypothetical protein
MAYWTKIAILASELLEDSGCLNYDDWFTNFGFVLSNLFRN